MAVWQFSCNQPVTPAVFLLLLLWKIGPEHEEDYISFTDAVDVVAPIQVLAQ